MRSSMLALTAAALIGLSGAAYAQGSTGAGGTGSGSGPVAGQPNVNGNVSGGATSSTPAPGSTLTTQPTRPTEQGANPPTIGGSQPGTPPPVQSGSPSPTPERPAPQATTTGRAGANAPVMTPGTGTPTPPNAQSGHPRP